MKDFSPQFSNPTQELLDAMQEKIYSLERRLNATGRDREGTGELLRVERYDIWEQNRAITASPLVPEYLPDAHVLSRRQSFVHRSQASDTSLLSIDGDSYDWNESVDDDTFCTDAMGATSTRECKPGFFGKHHLSTCNYSHKVALQHYHLQKESKRPFRPLESSPQRLNRHQNLLAFTDLG